MCGAGDLLGLPGEFAPRTGPALERRGYLVRAGSVGTTWASLLSA
jgi:hypothetical protein